MQLYLTLVTYAPEALAQLTKNPQKTAPPPCASRRRPGAASSSPSTTAPASTTRRSSPKRRTPMRAWPGLGPPRRRVTSRRSRASRCTRPRRRWGPCATRATSPCGAEQQLSGSSRYPKKRRRRAVTRGDRVWGASGRIKMCWGGWLPKRASRKFAACQTVFAPWFLLGRDRGLSRAYRRCPTSLRGHKRAA